LILPAGHEVSGVVAVALAAPGGGKLPVVGPEMLGHLLLEDLLKDGLDAFAHPGLHVPFHGFLELFLRGQVLTSSLNPQLTRHYQRLPGTALYRVQPTITYSYIYHNLCLVPTIYGVENTFLYVPNDVFAASFDGIPTFISPLVGLTVFVVLSLAPRPEPAPPVLAGPVRRPRVVRYPIVLSYRSAMNSSSSRTNAPAMGADG